MGLTVKDSNVEAAPPFYFQDKSERGFIDIAEDQVVQELHFTRIALVDAGCAWFKSNGTFRSNNNCPVLIVAQVFEPVVFKLLSSSAERNRKGRRRFRKIL
jgi:hypothetical protein